MNTMILEKTADPIYGLIDMMFLMKLCRGRLSCAAGEIEWEPGMVQISEDDEEPDGTTSVSIYVSPCDEDDAEAMADAIAKASGADRASIDIDPTGYGDCRFTWSLGRVWNGRKGNLN